MIPETWRSKRLVIEPIHIAKVTNSSTGKKLVLRGELNLKVAYNILVWAILIVTFYKKKTHALI